LDSIPLNDLKFCYLRTTPPFDPSLDSFVFLHWDFTPVVTGYILGLVLSVVFLTGAAICLLLIFLAWNNYCRPLKEEGNESSIEEASPENNSPEQINSLTTPLETTKSTTDTTTTQISPENSSFPPNGVVSSEQVFILKQ
jgi:cytoskeletal protein RodZ